MSILPRFWMRIGFLWRDGGSYRPARRRWLSTTAPVPASDEPQRNLVRRQCLTPHLREAAADIDRFSSGLAQTLPGKVGAAHVGRQGLRQPPVASPFPSQRSWSSAAEAAAAAEEECPAGRSKVLAATLASVNAAVEAIQAGRLIAVPTDTLYGLASCAGSTAGIAAIYGAKRRELRKPLAICVADPSDVTLYAYTEHLAEALLEDLLPGPVTLLLRRRADAPLAPELNPGAEAVGIRVPDYAFIRAVCRQHGGALALTSANISNGLSSTRISEFEELWPACELVFDGGEIRAGRSGSTVIDLTQPGRFGITRQGVGHDAIVQLLMAKYGLVQQQ